MFGIFSKVIEIATRHPDWEPPEHWRTPPALRSDWSAHVSDRKRLRALYGRSGWW